jgi:hypothetical protein
MRKSSIGLGSVVASHSCSVIGHPRNHVQPDDTSTSGPVNSRIIRLFGSLCGCQLPYCLGSRGLFGPPPCGCRQASGGRFSPVPYAFPASLPVPSR